ncbi:SRPBCC family protein [Xylanimonas sp. McL0601]|uniref:SRPBCC family protein n=1 Tax=Xylanimonas sp. McL0601 TaxID=3414739 RepID=UPI003CECCCB3
MRRFRLESRWHIPADVDAVWDELADPAFTWPRWWPHLVAEEVASSGGRTAERWSRVRVRVRSPLGWSLRFGLVLESRTEPSPGRPVVPGRALMRASGDLVGTADVRVMAVPGGTLVTLTWVVALARSDAVGRLLRLLPRRALTAAHAAVMRSGERGLAAWLSRSSGESSSLPPRSS